MESESNSKEKEFKGVIVVTQWGNVHHGMTHYTMSYPRIVYELEEAKKKTD